MLVIPSYSQQDAMFLDLFVSGGFSAQHREHETVQTALSIVNLY
jgi:3-phosphoglycerate kinase